MTLPSNKAIISLHRQYAPSDAAFDLVFTHCQIIWEIARQLIDQSSTAVDTNLVKTACLLHDIGVYKLYLPDGTIDHKNYIKHGALGYELLKQEGFDEALCRVASCHTGVGLSKEEILQEKLPLVPADYFATTPEERLVMYADKFHTKSTPPKLMQEDTYQEFLKKFSNSEEKIARFREFQQEFGTPNLVPLQEKYGLEII